MAADFISIDRSKQHGNQTVSAAGRLQEVQDIVDDLEANAQHMWDAGQYDMLESKFGLQPGAGANFLSLLGQVRTALRVPILTEFVSRVAGQ